MKNGVMNMEPIGMDVMKVMGKNVTLTNKNLFLVQEIL